ncbi:hypothetical protein AGMMS50256_13200 [Betaproteobacteria bacterium]|nr:hypothetical protein AGMMS50256_13200 [Betaproteobacteria bacterium]
MISSITLFTYEFDNQDIAVNELNEQLHGFELLAHTVGILMCDTEFIDSGVYKAVCAALPFDVVGTTTMTQAVDGEAGVLMLTVMVLTADDVFFEVGYTEPIPSNSNIAEHSKAGYESVAARLPSGPKLIFVFPPLLENAGDEYILAFESFCPNVPIFGTLAIDDSITFEHCHTFHNGEMSQDRLAFILVSGNVSPRFLMGTIADENKLPYSGEITKSKGHIVQEINNALTSKYFESIGFAKNGKLDDGLQFVPFLLDFKKRADHDDIPVVRAMVYFDENGYGVGRGYMDEGSVFFLTNPSADEIFKSSLGLIDRLRELPDKQAIIIFSCVVRRMTFGTQPLREAEMITEKLSGGPPFMFAYAGGEFCPTSYTDGKVTNRFHNYSIIACVL